MTFAGLLVLGCSSYRPARFAVRPPVIDSHDDAPIPAPTWRQVPEPVYLSEISFAPPAARGDGACPLSRRGRRELVRRGRTLLVVFAPAGRTGNDGARPRDHRPAAPPLRGATRRGAGASRHRVFASPTRAVSATKSASTPPIDPRCARGRRRSRRAWCGVSGSTPPSVHSAGASRRFLALRSGACRRHRAPQGRGTSGGRSLPSRRPELATGNEYRFRRRLGDSGDDPNDLVPHEDRRSLRALKVFASWIALEGLGARNTVNRYVGAPGEGHVVHYFAGLESGARSGERGAGAQSPAR